MKNSANSGRAPVLLIFVFGILGLVLIVGVAVDRRVVPPGRHLQDAANVAALSGALSCTRGDAAWIQRAYEAARKNGYDNDLVSNKVEVYTCDMAEASCGDYAGNPDCIQVIVTAYNRTFLTDVVGLRQRYRVQAMALAQAPTKVGLLHSSGATGLAGSGWVFSVPPWLESTLDPLGLLLLFLSGAIVLGLHRLLRSRHVHGRA